jgi:hypothetical protein
MTVHEVFHVLSRLNPAFRDAIYETVGVRRCSPLSYPERLEHLRMTNSEYPIVEHYFYVQNYREWVPVVPLIHAKAPYTEGASADPFEHVVPEFLRVEVRDDETVPLEYTSDGSLATIAMMSPQSWESQEAMRSFMSQIGYNTDYVAFPEEALADNFAYLVTGRRNLPSPEILSNIKRVIETYDPSQP